MAVNSWENILSPETFWQNYSTPFQCWGTNSSCAAKGVIKLVDGCPWSPVKRLQPALNMSHKVYLRGWQTSVEPWRAAAAPLAAGERKPKDVHGLRSALVRRCHKSPSVNRSLVSSGPWEGSKDQTALKADLDVSQRQRKWLCAHSTACTSFQAPRISFKVSLQIHYNESCLQ